MKAACEGHDDVFLPAAADLAMRDPLAGLRASGGYARFRYGLPAEQYGFSENGATIGEKHRQPWAEQMLKGAAEAQHIMLIQAVIAGIPRDWWRRAARRGSFSGKRLSHLLSRREKALEKTMS